MMVYLKNMAGFNMDFFKGMTYTDIRPIFEKHFNSIWAFQKKGEKELEEEDGKRKGESLEEKAANKKKIDEEVEELKTHLQIVPNDEDDVYIKATPLALKPANLLRVSFESATSDAVTRILMLSLEPPDAVAIDCDADTAYSSRNNYSSNVLVLAPKSDVLRTAESDSDDKEEYEIKRNKFGAPMYGPRPVAYLNCNDPAERSLALKAEYTMMNPDHQDPNDLDSTKPQKRYYFHKFIMSFFYGKVEVERRCLGCDGEIDEMLRIRFHEAGSNKEIFASVAWIRAFNIDEQIYAELCHEFYSTYEFDEVCVDDELKIKKIINFKLGGRGHNLTLLEFARRLGLYHVDELDEEGFDVYFQGGLCSDEHFNAQEDLDTTTLRELIDSEGRLIPEDPQPGPQYDQYYQQYYPQQYPPQPLQYQQQPEDDEMILESVEHGPLLWPTVEEDGVTRLKKYSELFAAKAIQADCDVKATNIILQALPPEIYALVSTHKVAKDLWERIQMLMQGMSLTKQERECKLYDEFDKFTYRKGKTLCDFYLRFSLLLNDMNMYNMKLEQFQVNTKFLNTLPPEWITDTSLLVNHNAYMASSSAPQIDYAPMVQHSSEYSPSKTGLVVPVFQKGDDPIDAINHMMYFLTAVVTSSAPNPRGSEMQNGSRTKYS
nr:hypothetical protein [Tanacetum cinerariifolium]